MNVLCKLLLLAVLATFPVAAMAQEPQVGHGLICDTPDQLKQIVEHTAASRNFEASVEKVNAGTHACGMAQIAYLQGETVGQLRTAEGLRDIVQIMVIAVVLPQGMHPVLPPLVQYTLVAAKGEDT